MFVFKDTKKLERVGEGPNTKTIENLANKLNDLLPIGNLLKILPSNRPTLVTQQELESSTTHLAIDVFPDLAERCQQPKTGFAGFAHINFLETASAKYNAGWQFQKCYPYCILIIRRTTTGTIN